MLMGIVAASWACSTQTASPSPTLGATDLPGGAQSVGAAGGSFRATVTAHLDDPAAQTCSLVSGWEGEIDYALVTPTQVLWCRSFFVPSSLVRL